MKLLYIFQIKTLALHRTDAIMNDSDVSMLCKCIMLYSIEELTFPSDVKNVNHLKNLASAINNMPQPVGKEI